MYKLFLDDIRIPNEGGWIIARDMNEAIAIVSEKGCPDVVSFDHDLGEDELGNIRPTGYDFAKYLVEQDMNSDIIPDDFSFVVHSANPVGKVNITLLLNNYLNFKKRKGEDEK